MIRTVSVANCRSLATVTQVLFCAILAELSTPSPGTRARDHCSGNILPTTYLPGHELIILCIGERQNPTLSFSLSSVYRFDLLQTLWRHSDLCSDNVSPFILRDLWSPSSVFLGSHLQADFILRDVELFLEYFFLVCRIQKGPTPGTIRKFRPLVDVVSPAAFAGTHNIVVATRWSKH